MTVLSAKRITTVDDDDYSIRYYENEKNRIPRAVAFPGPIGSRRLIARSRRVFFLRVVRPARRTFAFERGRSAFSRYSRLHRGGRRIMCVRWEYARNGTRKLYDRHPAKE